MPPPGQTETPPTPPPAGEGLGARANRLAQRVDNRPGIRQRAGEAAQRTGQAVSGARDRAAQSLRERDGWQVEREFVLADDATEGTKLNDRLANPVWVTVNGQRVRLEELHIQRQPAPHAVGVAGARLVEETRDAQGTVRYAPLTHDPNGSMRLNRGRHYFVEIPLGNNQEPERIHLEHFILDGTEPAQPVVAPTQRARRGEPPPAPPDLPTISPPLEQLEKRAVIAAVKSKERRVYDLVNKAMERAHGWGRQAFKEVFEHKLTKYYGDLLDLAQSPFAEEAIRVAEQKAEAQFASEQQHRTGLGRAARNAWEGIKAFTWGQSRVQDLTIHYLTTGQDDAMRQALARGKTMYQEAKGEFVQRMDLAFDNKNLAIREHMGEKFQALEDPAIGGQIKDLIGRYMRGALTDDEFNQAKGAIWTTVKTNNPGLLSDAEDYADTLLAVGKQFKAEWDRAHNDTAGRSRLNNELEAIRIALATGQMGEATSMNKTDTQKFTGKLKEFYDSLVSKNIVGASLWNEATVGTAVSYLLSVKSFGSMVATSQARLWGGFVAGGAAAGVFGAAREKGRLTAEYWSYLGEREAGITTPAGAKKREWFDKLDIKRLTTTEVIANLHSKLYEANGNVKSTLSDADLRETLGFLADAKARWTLSSRAEKRVALIEIGGIGTQEKNRTEFVRTLDKAEKDLGSYVAAHADVKARLMNGQEYDAFLSGITTTQTQILEKGKDTYNALAQDSAQRLALTNVAGYSPEVAKARKQILWLWGHNKENQGTVSGLEAALKEFQYQANVEAVKRGIYTAAIGMGIGALTQEIAMDAAYYKQFGWQGLDNLGHGAVAEHLFGIQHAIPLSGTADAIHSAGGDSLITHSQNMTFDGSHYDLVDRTGKLLHDNVIDTAKLHFANGKLDDASAKYVADQMHKFGFEATFSADTFSHVPFTGTHPLPFGQDTISVPNELHWVDNGDHTSRLVLDIQNGTGVPSEHIIVAHETLVNGSPQHVDTVLKAIDHDPWFNVVSGAGTGHVTPEQINLSDLPTYHLADGTNHVLQATIPDGTKLVETSHGVYRLVSEVDTHKTLLTNIHIDDKGLITNLDEVNKSALAATNHFHLNNTDYLVNLEGGGGGGGTFDIRAGFLNDQTRYMGHDTVWEWGERTLGKGGPQDNLFKNAFRAWHHWDGGDNADIISAEAGGVHRVVHRVAGGFAMSDGKIGYENSLDFNRLPDNLYVRGVPESMFSEAKIHQFERLMNDSLKEATTWQAAHPGAGTNGILAHLQATNQLQYLAYKHGYLGKYFTESDWEKFRQLFEGPTSMDLHSPQIAQEIIGPPTITPVDAQVINNIIQLRGPDDQIPIPIIPILGRRGLEPGVPEQPRPPEPLPQPAPQPTLVPAPAPTPVYPYGQLYRPEMPPEERERYEEEVRRLISPRFEGNPDYIPDASYEIPRYLDMQRQDIEYWSQLEALDQQVLTPMHADTKAVVSLAVAGHQEHENIYRTLETLSVQVDNSGESIWKDNNFEVNLLVNWPNGASPAKTMDEIQRFRLAHPDVKVNAYTFLVTNGKKELGLYKKMVFDLALLRTSKRPGPIQDVAVIMNDADMVYTNPRYLDGMLNMIQDPNNAKYDAVLGRQDLDPETYNKFPTFHASMRLWHVLESVRRAKRDIIGTQGRNTIMRASSYAAIGGHRTKDFWSDVELGWILNTARNGKNSIQYSNANWVMVDPRRELSKFLNGEPVASTWFDFNSRDVRGTKVDFGQYKDVDVDALNSPDLTNPEIVRFDKRLHDEYQAIIDVVTPWFGSDPELQQAYSQALGSETTLTTKEIVEKTLGLLNVNATVTELTEEGRTRYTIEFKKQVDSNGKIIATGTEGLRHDLKVYKDKQQWKTKIRSNSLFTAESSLPATLEPLTSVIKGTPFTVEYKDKFELDYVVNEVFEAKEYTWKPESAKPRIIDVGSHIGLSVLYWKSLAPQARITAIEPNPDTATLLKKNLQRNQLKGVRVIQAAASTQAGTTTLYMPKQGVGRRVEDFISSEPKDQSLYDRVTVPTVKLSEMITEPVDLIKIDAEGAELIILRDIEKKLPMVKEINMEFHAGPNMPKAMFDEACEILLKKGFKLTILGQWGKPLDPEKIDYTNRVNIILTARRKKTPMRGGHPNRKK